MSEIEGVLSKMAVSLSDESGLAKYEMIFGEDKTRIDMLELRWKKLLSKLED